MQEPKHNQAPFQNLGNRLKRVREDSRETLAETAGAVEIDISDLERIESGAERPSEDILMLLIDHFDVRDKEAVQLWEYAGYEPDEAQGKRRGTDSNDKNTVVVLAMDLRTLYTDKFTVDAKPTGLVLNFLQEAPNQQYLPASRVGMSYEQAQEVVKTLQRAILYGRHQGQRRLNPPSDS